MKKTFAALSLTAFLFGICAISAHAVTFNYTVDDDFDLGTLLNLNHAIAENQLQINAGSETKTFPFINVAASGRGTAIRINTKTGDIIGEYWTSPNGRSRNPSRTTVDQKGNSWVSNRDEAGSVPAPFAGPTPRPMGSVTRIGLIIGGTRSNADGTVNPDGDYLKPPFEYNTCVDRDGDGLIRTSQGRLHGNAHILSWPNTGSADSYGGVSTAQDECIINYTRTAGTNTRTVAIDGNNDLWAGGLGNQIHEKIDGTTGQRVPGTEFDYNCGGYGGFIDDKGILWSARGPYLLRYDTASPLPANDAARGKCINYPDGYGLGMDPVAKFVWHTSLSGDRVWRVDPATGNPDAAHPAPFSHGDTYAQGVVVDGNSNVWVANSLYRNTVGHLRTDGTFVGNITVGSGPTGVAVDSDGKVWATNIYSHNVVRIDPNAGAIGGGGHRIGAVDLTVNLNAPNVSAASPYNYSDMTGFVSVGGTAQQGTWTLTTDSGAAGTPWDKFFWNTETGPPIPSGASIVVQARTADSEAGLSGQAWVPVTSGAVLSPPLAGRFVQVEAVLKRGTSGESPVLTNLAMHIVQKTCDVNDNGSIDKSDIALITAARNTAASGPSDVRDVDGDGMITVLDARKCVLQCTKPYCAP